MQTGPRRKRALDDGDSCRPGLSRSRLKRTRVSNNKGFKIGFFFPPDRKTPAGERVSWSSSIRLLERDGEAGELKLRLVQLELLETSTFM
jgi:hypothetical protein